MKQSRPADAFGRRFEEGQYVVYPKRQSSNMWLNVGRVIGIDAERQLVRVRRRPLCGFSTGVTESSVSRLDRVVIVEPIPDGESVVTADLWEEL